MKHTDEELRDMLLSANRELYRLTESLCYMKAPVAFIHNILHTTSINDAEEDVLNRLDRYKRVSAVLSYLEAAGGQISHKGNLYFFSEEEGVSWGTIEELLSDDTIYDGEEFVLTVEEIIPKLLKPLLNVYVDEGNVEAINRVTASIGYVFEFMLEDDEDGELIIHENL